jgi:hypothetical protein
MALPMTHETAATLGLEALAWLVDGGHIDRFLSVSGLSPDDLRARTEKPELLSAVLDFILGEEALAREFCLAGGIEARELHMASHVLGRSS